MRWLFKWFLWMDEDGDNQMINYRQPNIPWFYFIKAQLQLILVTFNPKIIKFERTSILISCFYFGHARERGSQNLQLGILSNLGYHWSIKAKSWSKYCKIWFPYCLYQEMADNSKWKKPDRYSWETLTSNL